VLEVEASSSNSQRNLPIPFAEDESNTSSTISFDNVGADAQILDLNVTVWIDHQKDSDLVIQLVSPDGVGIILSNHQGGDGQGYMGTIFDDGAADWIGDGLAPFQGSFQPDEPLSVLNGTALMGEWTLTVTDLTPEDTGQLWGWSINAQITSHDAPALNHPVEMMDVVFDRPMDPASITGASILRMVTPAGTITPAPDMVSITPNPLGTDADPTASRWRRASGPRRATPSTRTPTPASTCCATRPWPRPR
jgi:subtilisin-like proprotein convertase family protein